MQEVPGEGACPEGAGGALPEEAAQPAEQSDAAAPLGPAEGSEPKADGEDGEALEALRAEIVRQGAA